MTIARFSQLVPDLQWLEVTPGGDVNLQEGALDATRLRNLLGGTPEQSRSPWDATVFIRSDPTAAQPVNWLATMLLRQALTPGQQVRGPMVVLGPPDDEGEVTSIDEDLTDAVMAAVNQHKGIQ